MPEISSILVYSGLDLLGDGVMKLPFLRALRAEWPDAHITWLAGIGKSVYAGSLAELAAPFLDEVIEAAGIGCDWTELWHRPLGGRRFDLVIDTQRRVKTTLILRRIRHRLFISGTARFHLSGRRPAGPYRKQRRMVDAMLQLIALASDHAPRLDQELSLPSRYTEAAAKVLPGTGWLGFAPGAGGTHKQWPLERFIEVAKAFPAYRAVFLLGPDEAGWAADIQASWPAAIMPLQTPGIEPDIAGSPLFTIACARPLAAAVANDSGTGHLLAAADIPLLSLFGPTGPAKFAPYVTRGTVLTAQEYGGEEMAAIPAEAVAGALKTLLNESLAS